MRRTGLAVALLLAVAAVARADETAPGEEGTSPYAPVRRPSIVKPFRVRPWMGVSAVRLGSLDGFADANVGIQERVWSGLYNAAETGRAKHSINWALLDGLEAGYQLDPLVVVALKVGELRTEQGATRVEAAGSGYTLADYWAYRSTMIMLMGGAGFILPLTDASRLRAVLFLGTGLADVTISRERTEIHPDGSVSLGQGQLDGTGTTFLPEFNFEYEHDLNDSMSWGASLGYRFGGVDTFVNRHSTQIVGITGTVEEQGGGPVRDGRGQLLSADYSGLALTVNLTERF